MAAIVFRSIIDRNFGIHLPDFLLVYPVVMFAALLDGVWVGLFATALAAALEAFWVFPPAGFAVSDPSDRFTLGLFFSLGVSISITAESFRRSKDRVSALERSQALSRTRARLDAALENTSDSIFIYDSGGALIDFNTAFVTFHRFARREDCAQTLEGYRTILQLFSLDGLLVPLEMWPLSRALRGESASNAEFRLKRLDSGETWVGSYTYNPIRDTSGRITGAVVSARDISAQKQVEAALRASESRYRTAFQTSLDAIALTRLDDGLYLDINNAFVEMLQYQRGDIIGHTSLELGMWVDRHDREQLVQLIRHGSDCRYFQARLKRKDGSIFWGMTSASITTIDGVACILLVIKDVSDAKSAEAEIRNLAFFDPLTRLPNRLFLMEQMKKSLALSSRTHRKRALLLVDLDHFSLLNDTLGLRAGDMLLREVAARLSTGIRESDTVGRLGSDEFVVLIEDLSESMEESATYALRVGESLAARIDMPYHFEGHEWTCTCSIGVSLFGHEHEDVDEVLQQAEIALHKAKEAGRNSVRFFEPSLQAAVKARAELEKSFRLGLKAKEFLIFYQPQFQSGRLIGAEALIRWIHPADGILSAGDFVPLAEETRLILPLGKWVLETVCHQLAAWANHPHARHLKVAVNVSAIQLQQANFVEDVLATIELAGADPHNLRLELVESILISRMEDAIYKMERLRAHGIGFALDDFGTGYSSLSYLRRLPIDELKIDRSFVRDLMDDAASRVIAQTIVSLGNAINLPVIAEGVETTEQKDFLNSLGCDRFQGYLFSPPLPLAQFEQLLREPEMSPAATAS